MNILGWNETDSGTGLLSCIGSSNDTVAECPVNKMQEAGEFIVIAHNP